MMSASDDCVIYHQIKTPISFKCKQRLYPISLIQLSETLLIGFFFYLKISWTNFFLKNLKIYIRVRLFWGKMISGNHFPPNPGVWQQR